jgi:gamma-glutamyl-gamma-aminobutyrate hydrolase PuuD
MQDKWQDALSSVKQTIDGATTEQKWAVGAAAGAVHMATRESTLRLEVRGGDEVVADLLAALVGAGDTWVNALHSQAIDVLADGLQASAVEQNGIIQAIEHSGSMWLIGVQWHPEYLPQRQRQQALFRDMVKTARSGDGK